MVKYKLTVEDQRLQVQNHGSEEMQTWQEYRNRRLEVIAGTKVACVRWKVGSSGHNTLRLSQQRQAIDEAIRIYEERWGLIDWWQADITCAHVTNCILVTVQVHP